MVRDPETEIREHAAEIPVAGGGSLGADIAVPSAAPTGVVVFAHGSGSSRLSPRNRAVARTLLRRGLATILMDLLTGDEDALDRYTREYRFDIPLLATRLLEATDWVRAQSGLGALPLGYFGASTGAAAALIAAARRPEEAAAVVSRGGRPDLAAADLPAVRAPTLLIVGGRDPEVLQLNEQARDRMRAPVEIQVIPGATHLFEEAGALEQVARLAGDWFETHLVASRRSGRT